MSGKIGLAELIDKVKEELLFKVDDNKPPMFMVEKVELELNVTVTREETNEAKGELKVWVLSIGEGASVKGGRQDVQKIKVTLDPLVSKDDYLKSLSIKEREKVINQGGKGIMKGNDLQLPET
jgi:hypothetical protein